MVLIEIAYIVYKICKYNICFQKIKSHKTLYLYIEIYKPLLAFLDS